MGLGDGVRKIESYIGELSTSNVHLNVAVRLRNIIDIAASRRYIEKHETPIPLLLPLQLGELYLFALSGMRPHVCFTIAPETGGADLRQANCQR